jgi:glucose-1-phosphate adenylyltransferase
MHTCSDILQKAQGQATKLNLPDSSSIDMHNVCCIIMGGGQGTRLFPLTLARCKPAICFGGRYRLIDVPVSNSINSQIQKIFVITQFLASSLHKHIFQTYRLSTFSRGFIEVLSAEQKPEKTVWYQGTADSVRQNLEYLLETSADYFLILSGDQLYHMNFQKMVAYAMQKEVDVLVATLPVDEKDANRMGIMKVNEDHHIVDFFEKPKDKAILERLKTSPAILEKMGLEASSNKQYLASMGIYLFKREALFELLAVDNREDFGKYLIPTKVKMGSIAAFPHTSYWEDIGTIEQFYKANIELTSKTPPFDCYDEFNPIFTSKHHLPGAKIYNTSINSSIVCEGAIIEADELSNSLLGQRAVVKKGTIIRDSYIMGNDFYEMPAKSQKENVRPCIEEDCIIKCTIIDKNASIGKGVQLINKNKLQSYDSKNVFIRDGIIVVPRGAKIPDGFVL